MYEIMKKASPVGGNLFDKLYVCFANGNIAAYFMLA